MSRPSKPDAERGGPSPAFSVDREALEKEVRITFFRGSGPGGQHRNTTETGVRLFHPPSGITVVASERRSQQQNRELAFQRLVQRLALRNRRRKPRIPTRRPRAAEARRVEEKKRRGQKKQDRRPPEA